MNCVTAAKRQRYYSQCGTRALLEWFVSQVEGKAGPGLGKVAERASGARRKLARPTGRGRKEGKEGRERRKGKKKKEEKGRKKKRKREERKKGRKKRERKRKKKKEREKKKKKEKRKK